MANYISIFLIGLSVGIIVGSRIATKAVNDVWEEKFKERQNLFNNEYARLKHQYQMRCFLDETVDRFGFRNYNQPADNDSN